MFCKVLNALLEVMPVSLLNIFTKQKQPFRCVLKEKCSENMKWKEKISVERKNWSFRKPAIQY